MLKPGADHGVYDDLRTEEGGNDGLDMATIDDMRESVTRVVASWRMGFEVEEGTVSVTGPSQM